jgi:hypothetical protein
MAWSYNPSLKRDLDRVRFIISDTDEQKKIFQDEEINSQLTDLGSVRLAAAKCCRIIASRGRAGLGSTVSLTVAGTPVAYGPDPYLQLAKWLESNAGTGQGFLDQAIYVGGISISDKETDETDTDLVKPYWTTGMHDVPQHLATGTDDVKSEWTGGD